MTVAKRALSIGLMFGWAFFIAAPSCLMQTDVAIPCDPSAVTSDCPIARPFCDATFNGCRTCEVAGSGECVNRPAGQDVCILSDDADKGQCAECASDDDCMD